MIDYKPVQHSSVPKKEKLLNYLWKIIERSVFRYSPRHFNSWRVLLVRLFGGRVARTASIHNKCEIDFPWNLCMGEQSSVGEGCWVYALEKITIGSLSCIGKDCYLITGSHDVHSLCFELQVGEINIGKGCWLATGSYVLPNTVLEDFVVVGAKSLIKGNCKANSVYAGIPGKFLKQRFTQ